MGIIIGGLFVVIFCVFPVMFVAKKLGAEKAGLLNCFLAIFVAVIIAGIFVPLLPGAHSNELLANFYSLLVFGVVFKYMLGATYIASLLIALLSTVISYSAIYILDLII